MKTAKQYLRDMFIEADSRVWEFQTVSELMEEYASQFKGEQEKWISVETELPHVLDGDRNEFIVYDGVFVFNLGFMDGKWFDDLGETYTETAITHWQPLPLAPSAPQVKEKGE